MNELNISINLWAVFLFLGALQGIILSMGLLLRKKNHIASNKWLAFLGFSMSYTVLETALLVSGYCETFIHVLSTSSPLGFLTGPFLFFYLRSMVKKEFKWKKRYVLHFVPFLLAAILAIQFAFFVPSYYKLEILDRINSNVQGASKFTVIYSLFMYIQFSAYWLASIKILRNSGVQLVSARHERKRKWLKNVLYFFAFITGFSLLVSICLVVPNNFRVEIRYFHFALMSFSLLGIAFLLVRHMGALTFEDADYGSSRIMEGRVKDLQSCLLNLVQMEKVHLNSDLKIQDVAAHLTIPSRQLSQLLNQELGCSFADYINQFRVEEAKRLMTHERYRDASLLAIAIESGFNSQANFNRVFKRHANQTPKQYRSQVMA